MYGLEETPVAPRSAGVGMACGARKRSRLANAVVATANFERATILGKLA
jgi:hypothetical protein